MNISRRIIMSSVIAKRSLALAAVANQSSSIGIKIFSSNRALSHTSIKMAPRSYTLKYFNFRVLGEPIRWQFALAGIPFKDVRLARDTWDTDKTEFGWGRLPILQIDGDIEITQSCAISRYLAKEFGLLPESELLQVRADELVDNLQDLRLLWRPYVRESDPEKKKILAKEMEQIHFKFYLPRIEAFLKKNSENGFAVGPKLTWADLYLANFLEIWTDNHGEMLLELYPLLQAHKKKILSLPQIKQWNENRPKTAF